jgi:hypothetical protein
MGRAHLLLGVDEKLIQNVFRKPDVVMKRHILKKRFVGMGWITLLGMDSSDWLRSTQ